MTIGEIIDFLESRAPSELQESYDNSGLITGNPAMTCHGILVSLDCTEAVVAEAVKKGCNMIVSHHPIVFQGLKRLNGTNYVERIIIHALKQDIALYAIHTNLDNVSMGVNRKICDRLGIQNPRILEPKSGHLLKLAVFCPNEHVVPVRQAMFDAGAGHIGNYDSCSFNLSGSGTFRGNEGSDPYVGKAGTLHTESETRIETVTSRGNSGRVIQAMLKAHPYEEVAYDLYPLENKQNTVGAGMIGELKNALTPGSFLQHVKERLQTGSIRYTETRNKNIRTVAVCGGSGSFLLSRAMRERADAFITGDFKYHQFFDSEGGIMICDVGHYESEQYTIALLGDWLKEKFPKFAVHLTEINTNPVNYF